MPTRASMQFAQPTGADAVAVPPAIAWIAAAQCGVVTRSQLHGAGVTTSVVRSQLAGRRWRGIGRNVVVLSNAPLTQQQREWVAVLLVQKPVALAGPSASAAAGLRGFEPDRVHIVVAHATHTAMPRWVKIHESRRFGPADISHAPGIPRTPVARALIDTATWSTSPLRACAVLCAGVQQRLVVIGQLEAQLRRAGPVRHCAILRAIAGDIAGGGHTLAEIDLGRLAVRAGLGPPRRQALRKGVDGRVRYLDAEFELPDGQTLVVEVDGAVHLLPLSYWDDLDRQNELVIGGRDVLRFGSPTVRLDPDRVTDQLRRFRLAHLPLAA